MSLTTSLPLRSQETYLEPTEGVRERFRRIRALTERIVEPLEVEDMVIQSMPDVSPTRWHLAHTTWFFETFVLRQARPDRASFHPDYQFLFNSYYNLVGEQFPRPRRGLLSRPTAAQIMEYRAAIDANILQLLSESDESASLANGMSLAEILEIGLNHEQQHQELMLTDIKHVFSCNPLHPVYRSRPPAASASPAPQGWRAFDEGVCEIGHTGPGFCYDNELPRHHVFLHAFQIADRLVTNAEYLEFMQAGGYSRPELWLSDGWGAVKSNAWDAPGYWELRDGQWMNFTLSGLQPVDPAGPACHVSLFEADAFARWRGARLPTEAEWEVASEGIAIDGNFVDRGTFHPVAAHAADELPAQMFGDVWEWTASPYVGYPGYHPPEGAVGEYNGKFMCNQYVLRGGSCATSRDHIRRTYRNFFPPAARWQFTGLRLARDGN